MPSFREPPEDVLRRLREIRPGAELYYAGEGDWWLGEVKSDARRRLEAMAVLARLARLRNGRLTPDRNDKRLARALLMLEGFGWIATFRGDPDGRIVEDFRQRVWNEVHNPPQEMPDDEAARREASRAALHDYLSTEGRDRVRHIYRHRHTILVPQGAN